MMNKTYIATILAVMILIGAAVAASMAVIRDNTSTNSDSRYGKICLDGVVYWRGYQLLAVKYKPDGNVELCK